MPTSVRFRRLDTDAPGVRARFAVIADETIIGQVDEIAYSLFVVADAGLGVARPDGQFNGRAAALAAILDARTAAPARQLRPSGLTGLQEAVLDAEAHWATQPAPGLRERASTTIGISPTNYVQILNALIDNPAARAHAPATVARLRMRRNAGRVRRARVAADLAAAS